MTVTLKLLIISPANISIFTSMDPEKLGDALRKFGLPAKFCFSISYGYRVLPAKGFSRSLESRKVTKLKFSYMKVTFRDIVILSLLTLAVVTVIIVGKKI